MLISQTRLYSHTNACLSQQASSLCPSFGSPVLWNRREHPIGNSVWLACSQALVWLCQYKSSYSHTSWEPEAKTKIFFSQVLLKNWIWTQNRNGFIYIIVCWFSLTNLHSCENWLKVVNPGYDKMHRLEN